MRGNPNYSHFSEYQTLLLNKFRGKRGEKYNLAELAIFLGKSYDTADRYVGGRLPIYADCASDINQFVAVKNPEDTELQEFFCAPGFIPIIGAKATFHDDRREQKELDLTVHLGRAIESIEAAFEDGKVSHQEHQEIHKHLMKIQQRAAELDQSIAKEAK